MMKNILLSLTALTICLVFNSCEKDTDDKGTNMDGTCFIINYGTYADLPSTVSVYNRSTDTILNNYYENKNQVTLTSNIQFAYEYKDDIYLLGNVADQLIRLDKATFEQNTNGVGKGISTPRYCVGSDNKLYISCWGASPDWNLMSDSYIAVYDISGDSVESQITLPGGPEGLEIANGKLYAAMNFVDSIAVIDLETKQIDYIATPAVSSYMVKDLNDNLYLSLISTFSDYSEQTGLGYINTSTDELETVYNLPGVSDSYISIIDANSDFSKIYLMTSAYDENWNLSGAVAIFDVTTKSFEEDLLVTNVSGLNGLSVDKQTDNIFYYISESVINSGTANILSPEGNEISTFQVGAAPFMAVFID